MVKAVQFVIDNSGRKTAVDFYDRALAKQRASEPRESLESVKKRVLGGRRRRRRG